MTTLEMPRVAGVPVLDAVTAREVAAELAAEFAVEAAERDALRTIPVAEMDRLSASGLLATTVPAEYGGPGLGAADLAEVVRLISSADPSIGQIPHSHFVYVNALVHQGTPEQKRFLFGEVLDGKRFGNAQSELRTKDARSWATTLRPDRSDDSGGWVLDGQKAYCTGALLADWIPVLAHLDRAGDGGGPMHVAWVERHAEGVSVVDDWDGMGQRTTASGSVRLAGVRVAADRVTPYHLTFTGPQTYGSFAQLLHAAIDAGIARGALVEAAEFVRTRSRPYADAGVETAAEDPLTVHAFGQLELAVRGCEALLREAGAAVDAADEDLTDATAAEASLAVAAARAATTDASLAVGSRLFEVAGTRSALDGLDLHRHWRNARTHTLHDPASWKVQHLGQWALNGTPPPRHGQI